MPLQRRICSRMSMCLQTMATRLMYRHKTFIKAYAFKEYHIYLPFGVPYMLYPFNKQRFVYLHVYIGGGPIDLLGQFCHLCSCFSFHRIACIGLAVYSAVRSTKDISCYVELPQYSSYLGCFDSISRTN